MVRLAFDLGIAPEEIDALSPADLSAVVRQAQAEQQAARRDAAVDRGLSATKERMDEARAAAGGPGASGPTAKDLGLDAELEWDPSLLGLLHQLRAEVAELRQHQVRQVQQTARQQVESVLARDYADFMGPEPGPKAGPRDPALAKRRIMARFISEDLKDEAGSLEDRVHTAMDLLFGQKPATPRRAQAAPPGGSAAQSAASAAWREAALARPTHRAGAAEPRGPEKAAQAVAQMMRENGITQAGPGVPPDEFLE